MSDKDNPLARALARWDWEGGAPERDYEKRVTLDDAHLLQCLGAAVLMRWTSLPTDVQRELFAGAVSVKNLLPADELKEQIARFLHTHKDL